MTNARSQICRRLFFVATSTFAATASAADLPPNDSRIPWYNCLVEKAISLSKSPDDAAAVASAAMALCSSYETGARSAVEAEVEAKLLRDGVVSDATEARKVQRSVSDRSWATYLYKMEKQIGATVVQARAARAR